MALSTAKAERLKALSDTNGIIAAAAMDQRLNLLRPLAAAKGIPEKEVTAAMMSEFKTAVTRVLSPYATAFLLDPDYGMPAASARAPNCGLLLAYEKLPYDPARPNRMPVLAENLSVARLIEMGAQGVKILLHYNPFDDPAVNSVKQAFVERIGAECEGHGIPFFLEFLGYDLAGGSERSLEFAAKKPQIVVESMREFSKPRYFADVLKIEFPVNPQFVEGSAVYSGKKVYSRSQAADWFRRASEATGKPFLYLSAGVDTVEFVESLRLAAEAAAQFSGVLCGRATWKDGIPVYARGGLRALEDWLASDGVANITAINEVLRAATPWWQRTPPAD